MYSGTSPSPQPSPSRGEGIAVSSPGRGPGSSESPLCVGGIGRGRMRRPLSSWCNQKRKCSSRRGLWARVCVRTPCRAGLQVIGQAQTFHDANSPATARASSTLCPSARTPCTTATLHSATRGDCMKPGAAESGIAAARRTTQPVGDVYDGVLSLLSECQCLRFFLCRRFAWETLSIRPLTAARAMPARQPSLPGCSRPRRQSLIGRARWPCG